VIAGFEAVFKIKESAACPPTGCTLVRLN